MKYRFVRSSLGFIILIFILFALTSSTRADSSTWSEPRPAPGTVAEASATYQAETPPLIYLTGGAFDPLESVPGIPSNLAYSPEEAAAFGTYILQFNAPVQDAWKASLIDLGVQIGNYIPDYAFLVSMDPGAKVQAEALPFVRWIGVYQPAYKLSPQVELTTERSYRIALAPWVDAAAFEQALASFDASRSVDAQSASAVLDAEGVYQVARLPQVIWIEPFYLNQLHNNVAAGNIMNGSVAWSNGFTGSGNTIAVTDSGLDTGNPSNIHPDFSGRVSQISSWPVQAINWGSNCFPQNPGANDGAADIDSGHGSHVTGSVAGSGAASSGQFKGTAYQAAITFQAVEQLTDWPAACPLSDGYYVTGIPADLRLLLNEVYAWGARVQNYSWGGGTPGLYDSQANQVDDFVYNHKDLALVVSAGNSGVDWNQDGYADADSISSPGVAKNLITIGASDSERSVGGLSAYTWGILLGDDFPKYPTRDDKTSDVRIELAAFSSRGPADDGRIKPDLVAPGTNIVSVRSSQASGTGWGTYNAYYMYNGGTSMASPLSAGAATLVRDYYRTAEDHPNPSAALIKATLINSAVEIDGYGVDGYEAGLPIPNAHEGWGLINVGAATTPGKRQFIDEAAGLSTGATDIYYFMAFPTKPFKVTLVWSDYPGTPGAGKALVNDLNLRLTHPDGSTIYWGNQFLGGWSRSGGLPDTINNVENIYIQVPVAGMWKVEVTGQNVPQGPQPYALVINGEIGEKDPLEVTSITPAHAFNNAILNDARILGSGFEPGAAVQLKRGTQTIPGVNVVVDTLNNRITADFNLNKATVGWWNVLVINSSETASLPEGFFVKDATLPDLVVEKTASVENIDPGSLLTYNINIENIGPVTATGVIFTDTLPAGVTFVSLAPDCEDGFVSLLDGFACQIEPLTLTPGMSVEYTLVVSVPADTNGIITNEVKLTGLEEDAYMPNNQSSASVLSGALFYFLPHTLKNYSEESSASGTLSNGGFEEGPDGSWMEESSSELALILDDFLPTTITAHSGQWAVWLGGADGEQAGISQPVRVPDESSTKRLSFWYWSASEETDCGMDIAYVILDQAVLAEIDLCQSQDTGQWTNRTLDLSAYAGTLVNLKFSILTNGSLNSNLFLDDVSFE